MWDLQPPRHISTLPDSDLSRHNSEWARMATFRLMHCKKESRKTLPFTAWRCPPVA